MRTFLLNFDTRNAVSGKPFNCLLKLDTPLQHVRSIRLKSAEMPVVFNPIRSPYSTFSYTYNGTTYSATVADGNYSLTSLLSAAQTALNASGSGLTFTLTTNSSNFTVLTATTAVTVVPTTTWDLARVFGFTSSATGTSITSASVYNLNSDLYVAVVFDNLTTSNLTSYPQRTFKLPVSVSFGTTYYYSENSWFCQEVVCNDNVDRLNMRVIDRFGNQLDNQGVNWSFLLEFDCAE